MSPDASSTNFIDFYEFLMVSPDADKPMIEWAVRLLATRFGKKNGEYVDEAKYNLVRLAYRTLSDPAKRAAFDALRAERIGSGDAPAQSGANGSAANGAPEPPGEAPPEPKRDPNAELTLDQIRIPTQASAEDVRIQRRLRQGSIAALYDILITRPRNPELGRAEIARATGVHSDDLEGPLWFLRETELLRTTTAGLYTLTAKGVEWAEAGGVAHLNPDAEDADEHADQSADAGAQVLAPAAAPQQVA